ncbi:GNAT family N-acetyltransferase [Seohaeicola sp. SP36]|uniref:GNAT family N-acetyltransferase n=1 Tax=unclassified Seohaeicola TaxID=2641111 RepID=UPI00237B96DE|nr:MULTISPECIES: GNAT family N-acetyltransferase [unclassified Seohaeicola]MDD9708546.1 GNAT family N-acetyltransferase [Seohaeicola sp. 4SK31]MDD9736732.1 GNAT family N-acetyltransferase [Seohaeicola sp. SP36]
MLALTKGCYRVRTAATEDDLRAALRLRQLAFHPDSPVSDASLDRDSFDSLCTHVLVEDLRDGQLVGCFRLLEIREAAQIGISYSAQYYDLAPLTAFPGPMIEIGRFCIHPDRHDPDILRLAWAALTRHVDAQGIALMFGCSSFRGTDQDRYLDTFAMLKADHLAPPEWRPGIKAPQVFAFGAQVRRRPDKRRGLQMMPPLLRTYLMMGGWVSDHAVIDTRMNTLHVFTGLEIRAIPDARKRLLRAVLA